MKLKNKRTKILITVLLVSLIGLALLYMYKQSHPDKMLFDRLTYPNNEVQ